MRAPQARASSSPAVSVNCRPEGTAARVEVPAAALNGLARNPNVEYVEEDVKRYPLALTAPSGCYLFTLKSPSASIPSL